MKKLLSILLCVIAIQGWSVTYLDLTTVNGDSPEVERFIQEASTNGGTFISLFDSMGDSYRSANYWMARRLGDRLGVSGYGMNNYRNNTLVGSSGGTKSVDVLATPSKYWFNNYYIVPPGGRLWWFKQYSSTGHWSDMQGIAYVKYPGGGPFTLNVSTNGGPWTKILDLDGYTDDIDGVGVVTNLILIPNYYQIMVETPINASGITNIILGPNIENSQIPGIKIVFLDRGGIAMNAFTNVSRKIRDPIFKAFSHNPLVLWHAKEPVGPQLTEWLAEFEQCLSNSMPNAVIAYIGTPLTVLDSGYPTTNTITVQQNILTRENAVAHRSVYVDCMVSSISYEWMVLMGYIEADGIHETLLGNQYFSGIIWNALGLYALKSPRTLSIQANGGGVNVSYECSTNACYTLQMSSGGSPVWQDLITTSGYSGPMSTNMPVTESMALFRLKLSPPL